MINWLFDNLVIVPIFVIGLYASYVWGNEEGYEEGHEDGVNGVKRYRSNDKHF